MSSLEDEILEKLKTNYNKAIELIPEELRKKFREKVIRPDALGAYATFISKAIEFKSEVLKSFIQETMMSRFSIDRFGRRLMLKGVNPERVYAELVRGLFEAGGKQMGSKGRKNVKKPKQPKKK